MLKLFICCLLFGASCGAIYGQTPAKKVMVMEIKAEIDSRMARYVKLALAHADKINADYVIIEMDTYGGGLTDAKDIVQMLLDYKKPIWVFVNSDAASAGALISIACDSIYMSPGASIGAATVVEGGTGVAAPDKYQSYMRSIMRSTAEVNGRDPKIAEGMVDERMVIDSTKQAGKVLTLTTSEAIHYHYCEAQVTSIGEILTRNHITGSTETFELSVTERIIAFILNPVVTGILILLILAGIYFEFQTPGASFPIVIALIALTLYLIPYYLNGLAAYWEIIALFVGILLLLAEIFVIPGFGVAGIAGITITIGSLILIMVKNDFFDFGLVPVGDIMTAGYVVVGGLTGGALLLIFGGAKFSQSKAFKRIALTDTQKSSHGFTVNVLSDKLVGKGGVSRTVLRPGGKVLIEDQVYDAFTRGEYIEQGKNIVVISMEGITLKVRATDPE